MMDTTKIFDWTLGWLPSRLKRSFKKLQVGSFTIFVLTLSACAEFRLEREVVHSDDIDSRARKFSKRTELNKTGRNHYAKAIKVLNDESDRAEFLSRSGVKEQQRFLDAKIKPSDTNLINIAEEGDIAIGMSQDLVRQAWGEPQDKYIAGHSELQNEKWQYNYEIATATGYRTEMRWVTFHEGYVVGWETQ